MLGWIIFFAFLELYSIGVMVLARRSGLKYYGWCLVPFVAFFYVDKILSNGFVAIVIKFKGLGRLSIKLLIICIAAFAYMSWGIKNLDPRNIEPLKQLALVPISFCLVALWMGIVASTLTLMFGFGMEFKGEKIVCMLLITIPVILLFLNREGKNYKTDFRRKE